MSTAMTLHQIDAPTVTPDQMELIKRTVAKGANADELKLYFYDCQRRNVHPLDKLIHFTLRVDQRGNRTYTPITSIDFMRSQASDSGEYAGNDDAAFEYEGDDGFPTKATVTVWRMTQGQRCPFTASARWTQYYPGDKLGFMWRKMPEVMLGKCAEALALRKAFPRQLAGLYSADEMAQADRAANVTWETAEDKQAIVDRKLKELKPEPDPEAPELEEIERWKGLISVCCTAADLNAMIPLVKDKPQVIKMAVMIRAEDLGLKFDKSLGEFIAPPSSEVPQSSTQPPNVAGKAPSATGKANPATPAKADDVRFKEETDLEHCPPKLFEGEDDHLTKITCHVSDVEKRRKKSGGEYWLMQVLIEGDPQDVPIQVWDRKLFEAAQALLGKDAVLGCRRSEKDDKVFYALEQIY